VLGSFQLAGVLLAAALALGVAFGVLFVLRRRRETSPERLEDVSLHLDTGA